MGKKIEAWAVNVHLNGELALSIGHDWLSGRNDIDDFKPEIRRCAESLLAFIGEDLPDVTDLRTRLAAAEQERDEFKESYRLAMVSVNDAYDKGKTVAKKGSDEYDDHVSLGYVRELIKERDELRAQLAGHKETINAWIRSFNLIEQDKLALEQECQERVAEKMDFLTEVGTLRKENEWLVGQIHAHMEDSAYQLDRAEKAESALKAAQEENERLAKIVDAQVANLKERDGRISSYSNALEREIELRTLSQQSAKEQFGAGVEWSVNYLLINQADCKICETGQRCWECAANTIREAAKEASK